MVQHGLFIPWFFMVPLYHGLPYYSMHGIYHDIQWEGYLSYHNLSRYKIMTNCGKKDNLPTVYHGRCHAYCSMVNHSKVCTLFKVKHRFIRQEYIEHNLLLINTKITMMAHACNKKATKSVDKSKVTNDMELSMQC
jgi:hypothetical protein